MLAFVEGEEDDGWNADGEDGEDVGLCRDGGDLLEQLCVVDVELFFCELAVLVYECSHNSKSVDDERK